ncbi:MAG: SBBP repeat-containing protein, partial [Thermoanaerobaculia bacterium]
MAGDLWGAPFGIRPLAFEENRGQTDGRVRFLSRGDGYALFLTPAEAVLALREGDSERVLRLRWEGAASAPRVAGEGELPGRSHYLVGNDPAKWRTGIASYQKIQYKEIYPGIDLVFYGNPRQLEYDFVLAPGVDPQAVRLAIEGADRMEVDPAGDLILHLGEGEVRFRKPIAYQEIEGTRLEVASRYHLTGPDRFGFEVGARDPDRPLVIDPVLSYSTYLGGMDFDSARAIAVDANGNAYVTGLTRSPDFPVVAALQPFPSSFIDAFVTKLDHNGLPVYSTFFGGSGDDAGHGIAVDGSGSAYVTGFTVPVGFPLVNPIPAQFSKGGQETFVAKLDPAGSTLVYSTTLGGGSGEQGNGIAIDPQGSAYVAGTTFSSDFPQVNPLPGAQFGFRSAFVAKLSPGGSQLLYSTFLGGSDWDDGSAIAVDAAGHAYVTGFTFSPDFPTVNALQGTYQGPPQ